MIRLQPTLNINDQKLIKKIINMNLLLNHFTILILSIYKVWKILLYHVKNKYLLLYMSMDWIFSYPSLDLDFLTLEVDSKGKMVRYQLDRNILIIPK